ncbi:hypothetical protein HYH03_009436 [Edaphochlamys debaryana]|uniref:Oxysterol-binding protein n=1 Tax=Edaphochlamys debaryana TaxID=47281 RepID=A0A835Y043_9CHLO|nr:hypothetical protein HYH03_009436 [Edaphochlamys debaryana]|eukprot:KAG2492188.1 hypothetical protein HYH03_009436 [Edaphochlamys debaryana]
MLCTNDELMKQQREAIMQWVKSMGKRLLTGNINLINTPFPVTIFEPRSYLEKLADVWVYPRFLEQAAKATDPLERMKLVSTWFVAGLHLAFANWRKPFNPILGETWQASLSDGTSMSMEQISHHPPVTAFHMEGPGGSYCFRGLSQPTVSIVVKYYGFKTVAKGFRYVEFPDGTRIELHYPQYMVKNVVYGASRTRAEVDGQAILVDVRNKLKTVINFGPIKGARNKVLRRADAVHGYIYDCRDNQASLEERTSTADAEFASERHTTSRPAAGGGEDGEDDEEFESASENEYDPEREDVDASAALEAAAKEAQAADADGSNDFSAVAEAPSEEPSPSSTLQGTSAPGSRVLQGRVSQNGETPAGLPGSSSTGSMTKVEAAAAGNGRVSTGSGEKGGGGGGAGGGGGGSSFFGMSAFKGILRLSQAPTPTNVDPTPSDSEGVAVAGIEGSWLSHINIDGARYWSVDKEVADQWRPIADPLPSDSRYRQDLVVLAGGDVKGAQRAKELLENMQRNDKKLRDAAAGTTRHSSH